MNMDSPSCLGAQWPRETLLTCPGPPSVRWPESYSTLAHPGKGLVSCDRSNCLADSRIELTQMPTASACCTQHTLNMSLSVALPSGLNRQRSCRSERSRRLLRPMWQAVGLRSEFWCPSGTSHLPLVLVAAWDRSLVPSNDGLQPVA